MNATSSQPTYSRQTVICAADMLKALGHSGLDRFLLELELPDESAGKGSGLMARVTSLADFAIKNPEAITPERRTVPYEIILRAIQLWQEGVETNLSAREREKFQAAMHREGMEPKLTENSPDVGPELPYTERAAAAVFSAIESLVVNGKRAYSLSVPFEAERILLRQGAGRITASDANQEVRAAIFGLAKEGKIAAFAEQHRDWTITEPPQQESKEMAATLQQKVFIVHGHDDGTKEMVARFIEKLGFDAIILHELANKGRTILQKFREEADVGFAVVLMTPDDVGKAKNATDLNLRARQNVVFELGFFIGALQPERVVALVKGQVERPSDFDGVVYIAVDQADWRTKLGAELKAAGLLFDWNKVL